MLQEMEEKGAIRRVEHVHGQILSNLFLRPKKGGSFRAIINLKKLNQCIPYCHFKMEGMKEVKTLLHKGDLMAKIDLKDAYWSVPIGNESRKFLRFQRNGNIWEFLVMAFGLGPAPRTFTKLMKVPISILRRLQVRIVVYLDDMLLMGADQWEIQMARDTTVYLLENLGFTINWEKSILTPSHKCEFLGMNLDSLTMTVTLPEEKIQDLISTCRETLLTKDLCLRDTARLIGKLYATAPAISQAPLQLRSLQQNLIKAQKIGKGYEDSLSLTDSSRKELKWWVNNLHIQKGNPFFLEPPEMWISSDASMEGWGAAMVGGPSTGGTWTKEEKESHHINELEMLAAEMAIKIFLNMKKVKSLHIEIDNMTALTYLVKMGGTKSKILTDIAKRIWSHLNLMQVTLTASWIPSHLNVRADRRSREKPNSSEWKLNTQTFQMIVKKWGTPEVDCFASRTMQQLPKYMSLLPDPGAIAQNAMVQDWSKTFVYLFPPFCMIGRALKKLRKQEVRKAILIAPIWQGQTWFPMLLEQCREDPIKLKNRENLLTNNQQQTHPLIQSKNLSLGAFLVTGVPSKAEEYRRRLPHSSLMPEKEAQQVLTLHPGKNGILGVCKGKLIPLMAQ